MSKIKVSWVQPNFQQGPKEFNGYYLPYSAGVIWSYAIHQPEIKEKFELGHIIWRRDDIDQAAQQLSSSDIIAFSTYVWNHRYNYALAKRIKAINPKCLIIFGGPQPAITDPKLFEENPYMDIVIKLEGEKTFVDVLNGYESRNWDNIPGLLINQNGVALDTGEPSRIDNLDCIPSPYLTGIFDKIIKENPGVQWNATLETNRGCPYACTFCDWGSLTYNKVKKFDLTRVFAELDWIGENCVFVTITDANFGMFVDRDNAIIDKMIEVQKRWGKLTNYSMSWAKNQKTEVVGIVRKLINESPSSGMGLTVSVQSLDDDVLENIKRKNLAQHKIEEIFDLCDRNNIPLNTEFILGLPGDTAEKWKDNFWKIFKAGNHTGISTYSAQMIANAEMNLLQRRIWKIVSVPVYDYMSGAYEESEPELEECVDLVISTKDIPKETMLDLWVWNGFIQAFHITGTSTYVARFLYAYQQIDYEDFYENLYAYLQHDEWFSNELKELRSYYQNWIDHGRINHPPIGKVDVFGWNLLYRIILNIHQHERMNHVLNLIDKFVRMRYNVDSDILDELFDFQKNFVLDYRTMKSLPLTKTYHYDFLGLIQDNTPLARTCVYNFDTREDKNMPFERFLENLYFGRKRNFGKAIITRHNNT